MPLAQWMGVLCPSLVGNPCTHVLVRFVTPSGTCDNEWLQDRHVITFLAERAYLNVVDKPLAWNYLVRAIMRHRKMTEASARKFD